LICHYRILLDHLWYNCKVSTSCRVAYHRVLWLRHTHVLRLD
jgi:hypothetical protein